MPASAPATVLVIEDDANLRALLADRRQGEGYRVQEAGDALAPSGFWRRSSSKPTRRAYSYST